MMTNPSSSDPSVAVASAAARRPDPITTSGNEAASGGLSSPAQAHGWPPRLSPLEFSPTSAAATSPAGPHNNDVWAAPQAAAWEAAGPGTTSPRSTSNGAGPDDRTDTAEPRNVDVAVSPAVIPAFGVDVATSDHPTDAGAAVGGHRPGGSVASTGALGEAKSSISEHEIQDVLTSDYAVTIMLNRLKESIGTAKEFTTFLKKRAQIEEDYAHSIRKLCNSSNNAMHRSDHREGTWLRAYEGMMGIHDRICEHSMAFATSLHEMQDELVELTTLAEKSRKGYKQSGMTAEQRLQDLEASTRKSRAKYETLADEYERAKTGDTRPGGSSINFFKSAKSAAQLEEELLRKVQNADNDFRSKVAVLSNERALVQSSTRPDVVRALQSLISDCDTGLALHLKKYVTVNEKLNQENGKAISPTVTAVPASGAPPLKGMKEVANSVDNAQDLNDFILAQYKQLPPKSAELKYERHPVLNPQHTLNHAMYPGQAQPPAGVVGVAGVVGAQQGPQTSQQFQRGAMPPLQTQLPPPPARSMMAFSAGHSPTAPSFVSEEIPAPLKPALRPKTASRPQSPPPPPVPQHERSFSHGNLLTPTFGPRTSPGTTLSPDTEASNTSLKASSQPPQLGSLPFQDDQQSLSMTLTRFDLPTLRTNQSQHQQQRSHPLNLPVPPRNHPVTGHSRSPTAPSSVSTTDHSVSPIVSLKTSMPVFGVSLERLYERDGQPVPMVVYRCIQAVELFGLHNEGIYRLSGAQSHIEKLKTLFDNTGIDDTVAETDFRNPENFFHDVNVVTGLLKLFFRLLPDPLLTTKEYANFINAAKQEDDVARRDSLHAIINNLPDPNYATLKALTLHLHRVMENASVNRMGSQNLALVFAPTLLLPGGGKGNAGTSIQDAGWISKVIDTILQNTYQIFDED